MEKIEKTKVVVDCDDLRCKSGDTFGGTVTIFDKEYNLEVFQSWFWVQAEGRGKYVSKCVIRGMSEEVLNFVTFDYSKVIEKYEAMLAKRKEQERLARIDKERKAFLSSPLRALVEEYPCFALNITDKEGIQKIESGKGVVLEAIFTLKEKGVDYGYRVLFNEDGRGKFHLRRTTSYQDVKRSINVKNIIKAHKKDLDLWKSQIKNKALEESTLKNRLETLTESLGTNITSEKEFVSSQWRRRGAQGHYRQFFLAKDVAVTFNYWGDRPDAIRSFYIKEGITVEQAKQIIAILK